MTATPQRPDARRRIGRPALTSRTDLLDAAREIGFRDLTIGKVTAMAGVRYSTAYRHVSSLAELVAALVDDVLDSNPVPDRDGWREQLTACAEILRHVLDLYPGMATAVARLDEMPEWIATARVRCYDAMLAAGIASADATAAVNGVFHLAITEPGQVGRREIGLVFDGIALRIGGGR